MATDFFSCIPSFSEAKQRGGFIVFWDFLHLVNQTDRQGRGQVQQMRPMLLPLLQMRQQLHLDEGMIPAKNRLTIKQYICNMHVRWGIKSFLLCKAKIGFITGAEIYTSRVKDRHWPIIGSAFSVVSHLVPTRTTCCSWIIFTNLLRSSTC